MNRTRAAVPVGIVVMTVVAVVVAAAVHLRRPRSMWLDQTLGPHTEQSWAGALAESPSFAAPAAAAH